ncbi:MAG TPA: efflux RND transporter periplasmic adaptor subunit [Anaeromyxobacteraceae bacterium]|nr:efflux RND transporter periplasmic adaptor subunit [Anaeromyxobacteraceae bacterium]
MSRKVLVVALLTVPLLARWLGGDPRPPGGGATRLAVATGDLVVSSVYDGKLDTVRAAVIMSRFQGSATVVELAPDGAAVPRGAVLVRFDASALRRELLKLERDQALAQAALDGLVHATLPLELHELEGKLAKARTGLGAEERYLEAIAPFARERVVSEQEVAQERLKVAEMRGAVAALEQEVDLTRGYLHPAAVKQARAKLASAEQELRLALEQLENAVVRAPIDGVVVHRPIAVGSEFRTVRVGDTVLPSQPFLVMPDMRELVVHLDVPESELSRVRRGAEAFLQPLAFPELRLRGTVASVGSVALAVPGQPEWQKFFHVVVALNDLDPRLAPGMSVTAEVVTERRAGAVLVPRAAVRWEGGRPFVRTPARDVRPLRLGTADAQRYEVLEGLRAGDEVLVGD